MAGTAFLVLLGLAAPPIGEGSRTYEGPESVPAAQDVEPVVVVPAAEHEYAAKPPAPFTVPSPDTPGTTTDGKTVLVETHDSKTKRKGPPVPRVLSSITELPDHEVAKVRAGKRDVVFTPGLQIRNQVGWVSDFSLDRGPGGEVGMYDDPPFSTGRVRWNPRLDLGEQVRLVGTLDLANGRWAPEGSDNPILQEIIEPPDETVAVGQAPGRTSLTIVDPRELYVEWTSKVGQLRLGQMAFTWGLGVLSSDGNNVDRYGDMKFGDDGPGDILERILFGTKPFTRLGGAGKDIIVAVGGDLVYRDERARLVDGDLAGQALVVVRYEPSDRPGNWLGAYGVYRRQRNADDGDVFEDDGDLEVGVGDVAGQGTVWLRRRLQLIGAFEGVFIGGRTTFSRDENHDEHRIFQAGAAVRAYIGHHRSWLVGFDGGYASGDQNPDDDLLNNFTFDAGHTVGLVLFPQVRGWRTARSEILATDGSLMAEAPNGTQYIPTRGALTNAIYIHPKARYSLWERLEVWGGPLVAYAAVPVVDPYTTQLGGGTAKNSVGGDGTNRYYGTELDLGVRGRVTIRNLWLMAGLQYGVLLPGEGLANAAGYTDGPTHAVWVRTEIRY